MRSSDMLSYNGRWRVSQYSIPRLLSRRTMNLGKLVMREMRLPSEFMINCRKCGFSWRFHQKRDRMALNHAPESLSPVERVSRTCFERVSNVSGERTRQ